MDKKGALYVYDLQEKKFYSTRLSTDKHLALVRRQFCVPIGKSGVSCTQSTKLSPDKHFALVRRQFYVPIGKSGVS